MFKVERAQQRPPARVSSYYFLIRKHKARAVGLFTIDDDSCHDNTASPSELLDPVTSPVKQISNTEENEMQKRRFL